MWDDLTQEEMERVGTDLTDDQKVALATMIKMNMILNIDLDIHDLDLTMEREDAED